jgi:hypothetical protein
VARLYRDWWTGTEAVVDLIGTPMSSVGPAELLDPTV